MDYQKFKRRFFIISLFGLCNATNAFLWIMFSNIFVPAEARYNVDDFAINMFSQVFLILYLPGSILGLYLMERYGMRNSLIVGAALNALCAWVRFFGDRFITNTAAAYAVVMVGQIIGALAQPIFTNLPSRIAADWFPASERDIATVVAAMTNPIGNAVGAVVPQLIVSSASDMPTLMVAQGVWTVLLLAVVVVVVRDRPPQPPSAAAAIRWQQLGITAPSSDITNVPLLESLNGAGEPHKEVNQADRASEAVKRLQADFMALMKNGNFLRLMIAFGVGLGLFNAVLTLMGEYISYCNYDSNDAAVAGAALLGSGLFGAFLVGVLLEKTREYIVVLKCGIVFSMASCIFMLASMRENAPAQLYASFAFLGFALIPLLPVSLENAAECTYPVPEDNSAALLLQMGQIVGIVLIFGLPPLMKMPPQSDCSSIATPAAGLILGLMALAAVILLTFKKDYRRQAAEASRKAALVEIP